MNMIQDFLLQIGANTKDFQTGMIAGAIIVMISLFLVLFFSGICRKEKKKSEVNTADETDKNLEKIRKLEQEVNRIKNEKGAIAENKFNEGAVYTLQLLQREGRFVDFIKENIEHFGDEQVGAAVRQIHSGCRKVVDENFNVKPLFGGEEGEKISLDNNFDPSEVKMTGNVPDKAPYSGELKHKGWLSEKVKLPKRTGKVNTNVVYPAEIEF
ncbi:MAG: DUF2760 domain-containing protein [Victivallales bacterium]|nr:DUF2760 domain-containing protein [Victivallales bacterium]MCF7889229.1 DUF2760 domain-containing protein [Victivallales bacterium]